MVSMRFDIRVEVEEFGEVSDEASLGQFGPRESQHRSPPYT